ncbi:MAG TPA: hypothetical protein VN873_15835 [Candidatus Angelobacter sp.]|nr:hypothetical protein [Candidatus Angelobacter sp.]
MTPEPAREEDKTGFPGLRTWRRVYVFVLITFAIWIALLLALTRVYS